MAVQVHQVVGGHPEEAVGLREEVVSPVAVEVLGVVEAVGDGEFCKEQRSRILTFTSRFSEVIFLLQEQQLSLILIKIG